MDRLACLDLPAFPLQLQCNRQPEWRQFPCAIIDHDKPQGCLLWVNEKAREKRILPGMRYASALALSKELRATEMAAAQVEQAIEQLSEETLAAFSPRVEISEKEPGIFWLDLAGLERLFPDLEHWGQRLQRRLQSAGYVGRIVIGWDRFCTYALAKQAGRQSSGHQLRVGSSPEQERQDASQVPLARLHLDPKIREALNDLGVRTVGEFITLPRQGIDRRFGTSVRKLHELACGEREPPLQAHVLTEEVSEGVFLEQSIVDLERLLRWIESLLTMGLKTIQSRGECAQALTLELCSENGSVATQQLRPAEPTNDLGQWLELVRLRLESQSIDNVQELRVAINGRCVSPGQMELFARAPRRDLAAANRALARIRAELGDHRVCQAEIQDGHLPEARFTWQPAGKLSAAQPPSLGQATLVRRLFHRPKALPPRTRREPDGWLMRGLGDSLADSPVDRVRGPFIIAGGWWRRLVHREYHFAETRNGELLWTYYDRVRRRWFLHGRVE